MPYVHRTKNLCEFVEYIFMDYFKSNLWFFFLQISIFEIRRKTKKKGKSKKKVSFSQTSRVVVVNDFNRLLYSGNVDTDYSRRQHRTIRNTCCSLKHWLLSLKLLMIFKLLSNAFGLLKFLCQCHYTFSQHGIDRLMKICTSPA